MGYWFCWLCVYFLWGLITVRTKTDCWKYYPVGRVNVSCLVNPFPSPLVAACSWSTPNSLGSFWDSPSGTFNCSWYQETLLIYPFHHWNRVLFVNFILQVLDTLTLCCICGLWLLNELLFPENGFTFNWTEELKIMVLKLEYASESCEGNKTQLGGPQSHQLWVRLEWDLRMCISNKFQGCCAVVWGPHIEN